MTKTRVRLVAADYLVCRQNRKSKIENRKRKTQIAKRKTPNAKRKSKKETGND
jgi:hypothetical protein